MPGGLIVTEHTVVATVQLSTSVELSCVSLPVPKYHSTRALGLDFTWHFSVTGSPISAETSCDRQSICGISDSRSQSHIIIVMILYRIYHHNPHADGSG